jgi:hypothetical protein
MANKSKKKQTRMIAKGKKPTPKAALRKSRGTGLTIVLVLMALHGIIAGAAYLAYYNQPTPIPNELKIALTVVHMFANVVAAVGIWFWKKWALYLYAASTVLAAILVIVTGIPLAAFYAILPAAIVGWLLRTKWDYFD